MTAEAKATPTPTYYLSDEVRRNSIFEIRLARLVIVAEWLALIVGAAYLCGRTLPRAWQKLNTDFPNYYVAARLLREGYNTDRLYDWIWIQRQKNHIGIQRADQPIVAFVPNPPFSALSVWPLTYWAPLSAKRLWIALNLALLVAVAFLLHALTSLAWRRIGLLMLLAFPLHRNLQYGQYYVLLLLLFTLSLWCYIHQKRVLAGLLLGIGFGLKIFPIFFLLYFLRKKDPKAAAGLLLGSCGTLLVSLAAFGLELNRVYFLQVLPWALRGEVMDPYNLAANSWSSLMHHLLIFEPEWNPHPLLHAPMLLAVLLPMLQLLVLWPATLLAAPADMRPRQLGLEWAAYLVSLVAISTMPASYHFTVLILPMAIITAILLQDQRFLTLTFVGVLYLGICLPLWRSDFDGGLAFLAVPRLYLTVLFCLFSFVLLYRQQQPDREYRKGYLTWASLLACALLVEVAVSVHHLRSVHDSASERLLTWPAVFLATEPAAHGGSTLFIAMVRDGYHVVERTDGGVHLSVNSTDQLALTAAGDRLWVEDSDVESRILSVASDLTVGLEAVGNAELPVASPDGKWLAFLRSEKGRSRIWLHALGDTVTDRPITPPALNVFEMSFVPDNSLVFAAAEDHEAPHLFVTNRHGDLRQLSTEEARFPSVSPDGQWLAYSRLSGGVNNLWLKNMQTGEGSRITNTACNEVSPSWKADSKTLLFASDCARAMGLTAIYQRRVIP